LHNFSGRGQAVPEGNHYLLLGAGVSVEQLPKLPPDVRGQIDRPPSAGYPELRRRSVCDLLDCRAKDQSPHHIPQKIAWLNFSE